MYSLKLQNLYKRYGKIETIHGINLEISPKEFVVLVGPSGCGKSTALMMIAGLEDISEGEILIDDKVVNNLLPKERGVAMVFQSYALYPHMNVYNNMAFGLKLNKFPKDDIDKRVQEAAKILGLEEYLERKPSTLSGGQRQRVAMGRAIVKKPEIFLFDEPLSNLDAKLRNQMRKEIKKLHLKSQATTIYVTHDQIEAMTLADKIVVMRDGHIEQVGTPKEVFEKPANVFVAEFIGAPQMNIVKMKIREKDGELIILSLDEKFYIPLPSIYRSKLDHEDEVLIGIRPEDISLTEVEKFPIEWSVEARIDMVEPLGSKSLVQFEIDNDLWNAEIEGRHEFELNKKENITFNLNHLHIFDTKTLKAII